MCSSGWIKTKRGYVIFKNRDLYLEGKKIKNDFKITKSLFYCFDERKTGYWFGTNKYFSISTLSGPYKKKPRGYRQKGSFKINELVLRNATSVNEAVSMFKKLILERKISNSRSVIIANEKKAVVLEIALHEIKSKTYQKEVFKSNTFEILKSKDSTDVNQHKRLDNLEEFLSEENSIGKIKKVLGFKSSDKIGSICRDLPSTTVSSVIVEKRGNKFFLHYIKNGQPSRKKFRERSFSLS